MIPPSLAATIERQGGFLTRRQAYDAGISSARLRSLVHRTWQIVLPGVISTGRGRLTRDQRFAAAVLYAGEDAAVTGASAAAWYGLRQADDGGIVRLVVPRQRSSRQVRWVKVGRSGVPFQRFADGPRQFVSLERAVVEAARAAPGPEAAEAIVIEAVQRRIARVDDLAEMNDRLGRRGSRLAERGIRAAAAGAWSVPESGLFALVCSSSALPEMWCNPDLFGADGRRLLTPDGWFDDVGLAVMVHSRRYHSGSNWVTTVERDGDLVAQGVRVFGVAPNSIADHPRRVLARIEEAYRAARTIGGRADVRARRWSPW